MQKFPALTLSLLTVGLLASPSLAQNTGNQPLIQTGINRPSNPVVTAPAWTPKAPTTPSATTNDGKKSETTKPGGDAATSYTPPGYTSDPSRRFPQYPGPNAPLPDPYSSQYGNYYDPYNPYNPYGYYNSQGMYDNSASPLLNGPGYGPNHYNSGLNTSGSMSGGYPSVESYNTSRRRR